MSTVIRHSYEEDFSAWAEETADSIEQGQFSELNLTVLADEVRDLARSEYRELQSQIRRLLGHLLKWAYQPEKRSSSWQVSILNAREKIDDALEGSPSLKSKITSQTMERMWQSACKRVVLETHLPAKLLPSTCPWDLNSQILNTDWLP